MRFTFALLALVTTAFASPNPQGVTQVVTPTAVPPGGCSETRQGEFSITVVNVTANPAPSVRGHERRQQDGLLKLTLNNGVLLDQAGRTGYIADNYQFQFDKPPQHGAIYTAGFSICSNGTLALGGSAIFYQCLSGSFFNLYDRHWAAQCNAVYIEILGGAGALVTTSTPPPTPVTETTTTSTKSSSTPSGLVAGGSTTKPPSGSASSGGASGTASGQSRASASPTGSESSSGSGSASASSSSGAALPGATSGPQAMVAFAAGVIGAMAML